MTPPGNGGGTAVKPRWMIRYRVRSLVRRRWKPAVGVFAALCLAAAWLRLGPLPPGLLDESGRGSTTVVDRRGTPLYEARGADGTRSVSLTADALPPVLVAATIAAEDRRFWSHPGIDIVAIARALKTNLVEGTIVEGGSTISQQVAKLLLNRQDARRYRGWRAKLHESVIALRLEHRYEKPELLAMYLNLAAYGNQIVGVERASRGYFGTPASMLTAAQAAFLAGLPQRPSGFNPYRSRNAAMSRQRVVIRRMELAGTLTTEQAREARDERLAFNRDASAFVAPHFVQMVLSSVEDDRTERVVTTLDAELQAEVTGVIEAHRATLRRHGAGHVAVVVLDNATGEWLAWEGSGAYGESAEGGTINGPTALRQPGSTLKPFTYALAFEEGYTPATVIADIPSSFPTAEEGIVYTPRNYDGRYRGPLLARAALAGSQNVPAVAVTSELGVAKLLRFLGRAGLTTFDKTSAHYGLGLTLGNAEVRLDELVAAYAALARGGEWIQPTYLSASTKRPTRRLVSPRTAFWITDILSDADAREYVFGRGGSLEFPFPVAVKTGTSQAYHDNWTIGYSKHVTVGVWVGNFDRTPLRNSSGVTGAAPIFQGVMLAAERRVGGSSVGSAILPPAASTTPHEICALSGLSANAWCPNRRREWTASERSLAPCSWHHLADEGLVTLLPAEYQAWVVAQKRSVAFASLTGEPASSRTAVGDTLTRRDPAGRARPEPRKTTALLSIASPADGATYLIDPTLRREFQAISLKAVSSAGGEIAWTVDGRAFGSSSPGSGLDWPLVPGRHRIVARDSLGRVAETTIVVR